MRQYAVFGWLEVITTHQTLKGLYKGRRRIEMLPDSDVPRFTSKQHMIAYQAFADACQHYELIDIDYLKIKRLEASVSGSIWKFRYKIKKGWFFSEYYEMTYDEDWEKKLKEQEKKEKESQRRSRRIRRGR